jgi:hypothetical protein
MPSDSTPRFPLCFIGNDPTTFERIYLASAIARLNLSSLTLA